jgi:hypothetical protein
LHAKPHAPLAQVASALATDVVQATALPHSPVESHVSTPLPAHCVAPGVHTPVQAPPTHAWLTQGAAVPHEPVEVHVSTALLLGSHCVVPGAQTSLIAPHTSELRAEQPLSQALAFWPAVQFVVQELAFLHAVQFVVQELAF